MLRAFALSLILVSSVSFAAPVTGTSQVQTVGINGHSTGTLIVGGDTAKFLFERMTSVQPIPDSSNPDEVERAGQGMVCKKFLSTGNAFCQISIYSVESGSIIP
jgi:hypothetical protein